MDSVSLLFFDCAMRSIQDDARRAALERVQLMIRLAALLGVPCHRIQLVGNGCIKETLSVESNGGRLIKSEWFDVTQAEDLRMILDQERGDFVVVGFEAHVAVLQTVLSLTKTGAHVCVVSDAVAASSDEDRALAFEQMERGGVNFDTVEMLTLKWTGGTNHPLYDRVWRMLLTASQRRKEQGPRIRCAAHPHSAGVGNMSIGEQLRAARVELGLRLIDLSVIANCSTPHLSKIESNKGNPSLALLIRICDALGKDVNELLGLNGQLGSGLID